jgi:hypothetical protein
VICQALWFLIKEGLFNYVKHMGFISHEVYVVIESHGYQEGNKIYLPKTRVISKLRLPGLSKIVGRYHHVIERELVL